LVNPRRVSLLLHERLGGTIRVKKKAKVYKKGSLNIIGKIQCQRGRKSDQ